MALEFKVIKASRYIKVLPYTERARTMCLRFQSKFIHRNYNKNNQGQDQKIYACGLYDNSEFRFHRNTFASFQNHVKEHLIYENEYEIEEKAFPFIVKRTIAVKKHITPRADQEPIIDYLVAQEPKDKFLGAQTGFGKTVCSLIAISRLGYRTVIIVEGGLLPKWASDILKILDIPSKRTLCVRGSAQLKGLIGMGKTKEFDNIDIILMSSTTLQDWITTHETLAHEKDIDIGYGIHPEEFYEHLGIGHRLIDEVHKKFHFNFKQDLYTNTHSVTSLSATLFSYDKVLEGFYEIAYPKLQRFNGGEVIKYTRSYAVLYRLGKDRKVKTKEYGRSEYSHNAFENSVMKNHYFKENYFEMIAETLDIGYIKNYKEGNKAAIYVSSTDLATELVKYLKKRFPDKSVERYCSSLKDPYRNLLDPDIRVSTLGSGGTGHDIPQLTDTILTISIMSLQANVQVFGRTRFLPDQDTRFYFFNCRDVDKHMEYYHLKAKLMQDRAKTYDVLNYDIEM